MKKAILQSLIVALLVSPMLPVLWISLFGDTYRSPTVKKSFTDNMTLEERNDWLNINTKPVNILEHIKNIAQFIKNHWRGYLQATTTLFVIIFSINSTYLTLLRNNEP